MKTKTLNNKLSIPMIGLGTWLSKPGEVYEIVKSAIKSGYRHIDCAAIYGNEHEIGKALSELLTQGVVKREELFITSKLWNNAHKAGDVIPALKKTLLDLNLEYLDLYLIHWPVCFEPNVIFPETKDGYVSLEELPIIETYTAMEEAVNLGLVKSLGVSNFSAKKIKDLVEKAKIKPVMNQVEMHPYLNQAKLLEICNDLNVAVTCYSPLGSSGRPDGMLADNEPSLLNNELIKKLSLKYEKSKAQILLSWALSRGTIVIPKTVTPSRAIENFQSQDLELEAGDIKLIDQLDCHFRYVNGSFFTPEGGAYTLSNLWDED